MPDKNQCATCGEAIMSIAKKCPHCHTWQSKWRLDPTSPAYYLVWIVIFLGMMWYVSLGRLMGAEFGSYRDALKVLDTEMHYGNPGEYSYVSVLGKLQNESDLSWQDVHFEVRFFDANHHLIDTISDSDYSLIVLAHGDSAFRVRGRADKSKEVYDHFEIDIKDAREVKRWF